MNNAEAQEAAKLLRDNIEHSATPNMLRAIANQAPIAALVYGLALIDMLSGFFYGAEAKEQLRQQGKKGDGVRIRYTKFVEEYMSPAQSGCNYKELDLYESLRCNMAHSLTPGHLKKGRYEFELVPSATNSHGTKKMARTVIFEVPTFCIDVVEAAYKFLNAVEQSILASPEPSLLTNFKKWWDEGYSILASD